jgi:hypothetical protein
MHQLKIARDSDQHLIHELTKLAASCPPGHLEHLAAEHERITTGNAAAQKRHGELDSLRKEFDARAEALNQRRTRISHEERALSSRVQILNGLTEQLPTIAEIRDRLDQIPAESAAHEAKRRTAVAHEQKYRTVAQRAFAKAKDGRSAIAALHGESVEIADAVGYTTAEAGAISLAQARTTFNTARDAHRQRASQDVLAATIASLEDENTPLAKKVGEADTDVRDLAQNLAETPAAADTTTTAQRTAEADREHSEAVGDAAVKRNVAEQARTELDKAASDRPARTELMLPVIEPVDLDHALTLETDANEQKNHHRLQQQAATDTITDLNKKIDKLDAEASQFETLASSLSNDDETPAGEPEAVAVYTGTITDAGTDRETTNKELRKADRNLTLARTAVTNRGNTISRWANEARFATVSAEVKDRFIGGEHTSGLAEEAEYLTNEITIYRANLQGQIDEVEQDKQIVVSALCEEARSALKILQRAQTQAQLPPGLGEHLKNRRFLDIRPKSNVDTTPIVMRSRISTLVDGLVQSEAKTQPDGKTLTWQAVSAAVGGPGNFIARVLKPSTNLADERESVERMGKWSGGEKVTISLLLFCMLARLRAASRGTEHPGLGVLPMDNPLGTVNYVAFLDLQRRVAAANGIQLIFLSGLADMRAIGRFPNIIRMKNTHNHDRTYAQVNHRDVSDDTITDGITTARLTFPLQESLL